MGNLIYGYKNQLWKVIHNFQYTGDVEKFTLNPGKYLLICEGAQGGISGESGFADVVNYGGSSYGILDLKNKQDFYAIVGGNGEIGSLNNVGKGGFNGGGDGGASYNNSYCNGSGGGGASDIRLMPPGDEYIGEQPLITNSDYQQIEYLRPGESPSYKYIILPYTHKANTSVEWIGICNPQGYSSWEMIFGSREDGGGDNTFMFQISSSGNKVAFFDFGDGYNGVNFNSSTFPFYEKIRIRTHGSGCSVYTGPNLDVLYDKKESSQTPTNGYRNMVLFSIASLSSYNSDMASDSTLYSFKIWEGETLIHHYLPCRRRSDNKLGVYDIIDNVFTGCSGTFAYYGNNLEDNFYEKSLGSRLIVAGGGGGSCTIVDRSHGPDWTGMGGGIRSGCVAGGSAWWHSAQSSGYRFGIGEKAKDKTSTPSWGSQGAGGGGGGWYGGKAIQETASYGSVNGAGGSGYVLTKDSYKPNGYLLGEEYYLTDTFLNGGSAIEPQILVCVPASFINNGDKIIFPCVGETTEFRLPNGKYQLKCYGGDGGFRYRKSSAPKGGYASGILTLEGEDEYTTLYATVGGSGMGGFSSGHDEGVFPTRSFNGGGAPGNKYSYLSSAGGGGTDFRIGSDSLYARVIVAGGAGGHGAAESSGNRFGGAGGGAEGAWDNASNYGSTSGPGKQSSGVSFGSGGRGYAQNSGYGGAGGGGWYGGSGCTPNGSGDNDRGGSGGSGYVLTKDSYKPEGYLLGEEYYLTDTSLVTGGNTLPIAHTQAIVEAIEVHNYLILAYDLDGYKYFDQTSGAWTFLSDEMPSDDDFKEYGIRTFKSDEGLLDKFDVIVKSDNIKVEGAKVNIRPISQTITTTFETGLKIRRIRPDADFNPELYKMDIYASRIYPKGGSPRLKVETTIKLQNSQDSDRFKLYCVQLFNR